MSLGTLLHARCVPGNTRVADFFDLADLLLSRESIARALTHLDREALALLREQPDRPAPALRAVLAGLGLILPTAEGTDAKYLDSVTEAVTDLAGASLDTPELPAGPDPVPGLPGIGRAVRGVGIISELVLGLGETPARELSRGGLSQPETRRLAAELDVDPAIVLDTLHLARGADLVSLEPEGWLPTEAGERWLLLSAAERWVSLAAAWALVLPASFPTAVAAHPTDDLGTLLRWWYPAGGEIIAAELATFLLQGELLGLQQNGRLEEAGLRALTAPETLTELLTDAFPPPVAGFYLQHDLTIIAPGVLDSEVERTLRGFADLEVRAEASSYRLGETSIMRGLSTGVTAEEMLEFLGRVSLSGLPQPVSYLINQCAERFGSIRVGQLSPPVDGHSSYVRATDARVLDQIMVDRNLMPLSLLRESDLGAVSRFDSEVLFWALADAKYPAVAESADGSFLRLRRRRVGRSGTGTAAPDYTELMARLHSAAAALLNHGDEAWLARRLLVALKAKTTLEITAVLPGRGEVTFVLEPTGIAGGRIRGLDKAADTERTLPLSLITSVTERTSS
ncbi:helicase-associated domain-containing protein [Mycetocola spongiae]|uniref:helicase-associated domain-containing protein n=1 Tax=Mycetocola spongiae TaxID=2859226 RepID=UPI001CF406DA|nr:helicase-associated domain-containing protein [Mycetocola spongiae]UCR88793.1 helicase-associated domain-containing protein [Mycetocola spongiae]